MTVYGYLRVSTDKQSENNYKLSIMELANQKSLGPVVWIQETVTGRKDWRKRVLGKEFEKMKSGDTIIVGEYSRIGRDFLQSVEFVAECRRKSITLLSTVGDIPINNDAASNLMLSISAYKAQTEREMIAIRTKNALQTRKANGQKLGRRNGMVLDKDPENVKKIKDELDRGVKLNIICEHNKCTRPTLSKFMKNHGLEPYKITKKEQRKETENERQT